MSERLLIQKWFDDGHSIEELGSRYGIDARRGKVFTHLISFKYDQITSPNAEPIVQQCRGIVLDESDNWCVVARSFDRFFNLGMVEAAGVDWATARVQEKVDGSLIQLYWYHGWRVASSGTPDAGGEVNGFGITFADLFWRTWNELEYDLPSDASKCYALELMTPYNKIVVRQEKPDIVLLGIRDLQTQQELSVKENGNLLLPGVRTVREFPLRSYAEIEEVLATNNPLDMEGFVVCDDKFNRVKVKDPKYVALHRMRDGCTPRSFVEIARAGETSEVEAAFPEFKEQIDNARRRIESWANEVEADYDRLKYIEAQKDFALQAVSTRCSSALFAIRANKAKNARDYLKQVHLDRCMEWIEE